MRGVLLRMSTTNFRYSGICKPNNRTGNSGQAPARNNLNISQHASLRLSERLHLNSKKAQIDHIYSVRYIKGIDVDTITKENYTSYGLSDSNYHYIKTYPHYNNKKYRVFFYKNFLYIFAGNKSRTLITAFTLPEE